MAIECLELEGIASKEPCQLDCSEVEEGLPSVSLKVRSEFKQITNQLLRSTLVETLPLHHHDLLFLGCHPSVRLLVLHGHGHVPGFLLQSPALVR